MIIKKKQLKKAKIMKNVYIGYGVELVFFNFNLIII